MINWLLNDILRRWGRKPCFCLGTWVGFLQWLHDAYLEVLGDPVKNGGATDCCRQQFSRGFLGIIAIRIMTMS